MQLPGDAAAPATAAPAPGAPSALAAPAFTVGTVVGRTFAVWWRHLPVIALAALVFDLPVLAVAATAGSAAPGESGFRAQAFLSAVCGAGIQAAVTAGTLRALAGERVRPGAMLRTGSTKLFPVFLVQLGVGIAMSFGVLLLVVPGIVAACMFSVAVPAVVAEPLGPNSAMSRSSALTKGHRTRILAIGLVFLLAIGVALVAVAVAWSAAEATLPPGPVAVAGEAISTVVLVIIPVAAAVVYHDLRRIKEGVPASELARVFG